MSVFQLAKRRSRVLQTVVSMTEEQRADMKKALQPTPGKRKVSEIVSSDESDTDDDGKYFRKKILPGRSRQVMALLDTLDEKARGYAEKQGTCLFRRLPGFKKSTRAIPQDFPAWMKTDK